MKKFVITLMTLTVTILLIMVQPALAQQVQKKLLVINNLAESLSAVDLVTQQITHTQSNKYGHAPNDIVVYNGKGYIANSMSHNISVINLSDYAVEKTIPLPDGSNPWSLVFVGLEKLYVSSYIYNKIYVVNTARGVVIDSIGVGVAPAELLRVGTAVYVTNTGFNLKDYTYSAGSVSIINTETGKEIARLSVPINPQNLALAPNKKIYIVCTGDYFSTFGKMAVLDPTGGKNNSPAITDTVELGGSPGDLEFTSTGLGYIAAGGEWGGGTKKGYVYMYNSAADSILHDSKNPLIVGDGASRIAVDSETDEVFVSCFQDDNVQKLNPVNGTVIATYPVGDGPQGMTVYREKAFTMSDSAVISVEMQHGSGTKDTISVTGYGRTLPAELQGKPSFGSVVGYYKISSSPSNLSAVVNIKYKDTQLQNSQIAEKNLILSYYSDNDRKWHSLPTAVDTVNNVASAEIDHFSYWALTDKNDAIISDIENDNKNVPVEYSLEQNYPNPFNPSTSIRFKIARLEDLKITVYNILGQEVKTLIDKNMPVGNYEIQWDGTNNTGQRVASGIYFCLMKAGEFVETRKMMLLR